ncbi:MAG: hypothetical protein WAS54_05600 [Scrofimicrobium sp.]
MTFSTAKLNPIRVTSGGCSALNLTGDQRPWTIIDRAAKACGLNPQVILVTLQKEQSGLTQPKTDAVWAKAMGAGCPDNSGCDAAQAGFAKQIYYGAEKLATYKINATWEQYILAFQNKQSVTVANNTAAACGSQTFKLDNYATASLYMYTPYVGNGTGNSCPAIGQKMFWDLMNRYFPNTQETMFGWVQVGSTKYYFDPNTGRPWSGWLTEGGKRYYLHSDGSAHTGWGNVSGQLYYFDPSTAAARTGWVRIGTTDYYFNPTTGALENGALSAKGAAIANAAKSQVGVAIGECTWVVARALESAGINMSWYAGTSAAPYLAAGALQVTGEWKTGDILIWPGNHVAIYIGNGQAVHGGWSTSKTTVIFGTKVFVGSSAVAVEPSTVVRFS